MRTGRTAPKIARGIMANIAMASSLAKKVGSASIVDSSRASSNRRSRKNGCGNGVPLVEGRVGSIQPIYHGYRQKGKLKLLCLQGIQIHG